MSINIVNITIVGSNAHGYEFGVGQVAGRWVGFAKGGGGLFFFSEICEGVQLGTPDRDLAIRMTGACAQDPARGYGGIDTWKVPKALRGRPEDFICPGCGEVCCAGDCGVLDDSGSPEALP